EDYFQQYARAYDHFDAVNVATFFHLPCFIVRFDSVTLLQTSQAVQDYVTSLINDYREQGYHHRLISHLNAESLGRNTVFVTVDWSIKRIDNSTILNFQNSYNLTKHRDDWKILVSSRHDL
ncbi:MAG TPA: hypothetical protein VHL11_17635, partial [Phototrophicaceae bacterium]|nr:hypothetical protein [Phototrophicaceae bacterium]